MSICVLVKVPEGLALATDSAATVQASVAPAGGGARQVLKVFFNATKLMQLRDLPVGVMTWGAGSFGARTIASLIEEFGNLPETRSLASDTLQVDTLATSLFDHLTAKSAEFYSAAPVEARPRAGVLVCGYPAQDFFPQEFVMFAPTERPIRVRPAGPDGQPDFGANWYGMTDAIVRLHWGRDEKLFQILADVGVTAPVVEQIKVRLAQEIQYTVLFHAMPLGDAVSYAEFVVRTTIDRFRFTAGAELCGGPIDVATITRRDGFQWRQKGGHRLSAATAAEPTRVQQ